MRFHEMARVWEVQDQLNQAPRNAEVWVIGPDERPTPVSTVFREIGDEGRVFIIARPWLSVSGPEKPSAPPLNPSHTRGHP